MGEQSAPQAFVRGSPPSTQFAGATAQRAGQLGQSLFQLGAMAAQKQEEFDRLKADDANNRFAKALQELVHNPEQGLVNARRGIQAIGENSVSRYFGDSSLRIKNNLMEEMGMNSRQRQLFENAAINTAMPFFRQTQSHETRQFEEYRTGVFNTTVAVETQSILNSPMDREVWDESYARLAEAFSGFFPHLPPETKSQQFLEFISGIERQRIMVVASTDPIIGFEEAEDSEYLTPGAKAEVLSSLRGAYEREYARRIGFDIFSRFGMDEEAGYNWIRDNYEAGTRRDAIEQAFFRETSRVRHIQGGQDREMALAQRSLVDEMIRNSHEEGSILDPFMIENLFFSGKIDENGFNRLTRLNQSLQNVDNITRRLRDVENTANGQGAWDGLDPDERDMRINTGRHGSREQAESLRSEWGGWIMAAIANHEISDAEIMNLHREHRLITRNDVTRLQGIRNNFVRDTNQLSRSYQQRLRREIVDMFTDYGNTINDLTMTEIQNRAAIVFANEIEFVDPLSPGARDAYRDAMDLALREALTFSAQDVERGMIGSWWHGSSYLPARQRFNALMDFEFKRRMTDVGPFERLREAAATSGEVPVGEEDMFSTLNAQGRRRRLSANTPVAMVYGGRVTSEFGVYRTITTPGQEIARMPGTRVRHNGVDIGAPEGTGIYSADFGTTLFVSNTGSDSTRGNFIGLSGIMPDGQTEILVEAFHMQHFSDIPQRTIIRPGDFIGYVGNTGRSTGPHLHLQIRTRRRGQTEWTWQNPINFMNDVSSARMATLGNELNSDVMLRLAGN